MLKEFAFLKDTSNLESLYTRGICLGKDTGMLLPLCRLHLEDRQLTAKLSQWRRENAFAFPSRFEVTDDGTRRWMSQCLLEVPDRILFLVYDRFGHVIGHLGYANCDNDEGLMEIDNVVLGEKHSQKGIMSSAMNAVLKWARTTLWPEGFYLRVLSSNEHAIRFYKRLGFHVTTRTALRCYEEPHGQFLRPLEADDSAKPDEFFVRMETAAELPEIEPGERMILTAGPSISAREASYAYDAAKYGWNDRWSGYLKEFESRFAEYVGAPYAMATSSCTGALHIALKALGIGPGDEVIVPDITWVATANAVLYVGATPIFADIQRDTWLLNPESVREKISDTTKAILVVHLYGHVCDMDRLLGLADEHGLYVVEDAAPSIGAEYKGRRTGSFGHFACFSFQGAKLAVTGEGGMLLARDETLYKRAYEIWDQGRRPGTFWIKTNGLKYKMSNVQAAIGLGQLQRNDAMVAAKRRIFSWYERGLEGVAGISLNREPSGTQSIYWMSSILIEDTAKLSRDELGAKLKEMNVDTRPVFPAISQYPIWPLKQPPLPMAKFVGDHAMNLPSGICLREEEVDYVCKSIKEALK